MLELRNVGFTYSSEDSPVLRRVNLQFDAGEFSLITGPTGSGKTTLLKTINRLVPNFTGGKAFGQIFLDNQEITELKPHEVAENIGYVSQNPESSFVTETVREELAYGMEQLGFSHAEMLESIQKISGLVGVGDLLDSKLVDLSGGEQQRVAIGAALTAGQRVLLLDEPTSALDSDFAQEILELLRKISIETNRIVIVTEHRLERVLEIVDTVVTVNTDGTATKGKVAIQFLDTRIEPPIISLGKKLGWDPLQISIAGAKQLWKESLAGEQIKIKQKPFRDSPSARLVAKANDLKISFDRQPVLSGLNLSVGSSQITAIMGKNGSGKTTTLWALQGALSSNGKSRNSQKGISFSGSVAIQGQDPAEVRPKDRLHLVAMVPQQASDLLFLNSIGRELQESDAASDSMTGTTSRIFEKLAGRIDPSIHPRDLSSGQQLALVLATQLVKDAPLILLDEPTRGLDYAAKRELARTLATLRDAGKAMVIASHDIEFVAEIADQVVFINNGNQAFHGTPAELIDTHPKYQTQISKITQAPGLLTVDQIEVHRD